MTSSIIAGNISTVTSGLGITTNSTSHWPSNEYFTVNNNGTYSTVNTNQFNTLNYMENNSSQPQQVQVVVFEIERDEDLKVISTKHIDTFWIEQKPKADLKFAIAKKLAKDVDLDKIVIKEVNRVFF